MKQEMNKQTVINSRQLKTVVIKQKRERNKDFLHTNLVPRKKSVKLLFFIIFVFFYTNARHFIVAPVLW